jgi:hypothetical protein
VAVVFDTPRNGLGDVAVLWESPPGIQPAVEIVYTKQRSVFIVIYATGELIELREWKQLRDFIMDDGLVEDVETLIRSWFQYVDGYRAENPCDAVKYKIINKIVVV